MWQSKSEQKKKTKKREHILKMTTFAFKKNRMKTFLQECAEYLTGKYPELHRCCLILPSNRSIRSLREEFARCDIRAGRTSGRLMPDMCSIADWMETVSGCRKRRNCYCCCMKSTARCIPEKICDSTSLSETPG